MTKAIELFEKHEARIAEALPRNMSLGRFKQMAAMAIYQNTELQECDPASFVAAAIQAAQLGLWPDQNLGHAYLVPFWDKRRKTKRVQLILGYRGLIELMMRSGKVKAVQAEVVRAGDKFSFRLGTDPEIEHVPKLNNDGEIVAAYAVATLADGTRTFQVIDKKRIERAKEASAAGNKGPWATDFEEMVKKTAVRALAKYLQLSVDTTIGVVIDEYGERGIDTTSGTKAFLVEDFDLKEKTERLKRRLGFGPHNKERQEPNQETTRQEQRGPSQNERIETNNGLEKQVAYLWKWVDCLPDRERATWEAMLNGVKSSSDALRFKAEYGKKYGVAPARWRQRMTELLQKRDELDPLQWLTDKVAEYGIRHVQNVPKPVAKRIEQELEGAADE